MPLTTTPITGELTDLEIVQLLRFRDGLAADESQGGPEAVHALESLHTKGLIELAIAGVDRGQGRLKSILSPWGSQVVRWLPSTVHSKKGEEEC